MALLTIVSVAVYVRAAVGLKVILRLQVLPGATAAAQVPKVATNAGSVALAETIASGLTPVFVTRTLPVALAPIRVPPPPPILASAMVAVVAATMPVPFTVTLVGEPAALWTRSTRTVFRPVVVGLNCTLTVQEPPGMTVVQPFVNVNCPASSPVNEAPDTMRPWVPLLVIVIACAAVVVPTTTSPKPTAAGAIAATGADARPVPLTETLEGDPTALWAMETVAALAPVVVGANRTVISQKLPGVTVVQPFVNKNSVVLPVKVAPDTTWVLDPVLVTLMA